MLERDFSIMRSGNGMGFACGFRGVQLLDVPEEIPMSNEKCLVVQGILGIVLPSFWRL